ncbi:MAG: SIR2 family protein [Actinobacteria bacterium]|nr:SIR2 family protein [Actinomycetota bacterium]
MGAGLSVSGIRAGGQGLPDWKTLLRHAINDLRDSEKCDAETLTNLETWLEGGKYLEIAQEFHNRTRPDQFAEFIRAEFDPDDLVPSKLHETILQCKFRGVITTNFDKVFERQGYSLDPLVYPLCLDDLNGFKRLGFFAKIHGCVRQTPNLYENLVLTEASYASLRRNQKYRLILQSYFVRHTILTVGFSLQDPDFLGLLADLRDILGDATPTVYALMREPGHEARDKWRKQGVEIIPYGNHAELLPFFDEMVKLATKKHPVPTLPSGAGASEIDYDALAEIWRGTHKIEELSELIERQLSGLSNGLQKESFLLQFLALVGKRDQVRLAPQLVALGTPRSEKALLLMFRDGVEGEKGSAPVIWPTLQPHPKHVNVHQWVLSHWPDFAQNNSEACFEWLLNKEWEDAGIDLWQTFLSVLNRIVAGDRRLGLDALYSKAEHIEGAHERIEKVVFAPGFVREDDTDRKWFKSWDEQTLESIRYAKFQKARSDGRTYSERLAEAMKLDENRPENVYRPYVNDVLHSLFDEYVQRTHLTTHSSSGLYNPEKANEILDALSALKGEDRQLKVLWAINHWPETRRGLGSLGEDAKSLRNGLFAPLWWRYSNETRIAYLREHRGRRMHGNRWEAGQEVLLERMMGFTYDVDEEFREAFTANLSDHLSKDGSDSEGFDTYEPRPFQEIWRDRELTYKLTDEIPPELVWRVAAKRVDWENQQDAKVRWREARDRAKVLFAEASLSGLISAERNDYVIDGLLGAYFPEKLQVVIYSRMISLAAKELGVDRDALGTVVFLHLTAHAFSHIGKDRDGRTWSTFAMPLAVTNARPSRPSEAIAQFYTFRLIATLGDQELMQTFFTLERHCTEIHRAWRATEEYDLEQMRAVLVKYRKGTEEWPPPV